MIESTILGKVKRQLLDKKVDPLYKEPDWKLAIVKLVRENIEFADYSKKVEPFQECQFFPA
jgi:hypothetical protein